MSENALGERRFVRRLPRAAAAWIVAALLLCFVSALGIRAGRLPSSALGYVSSSISFLCALAAGAVCGRGEGRLRSGLLCGLALVVLLLTLGYLIAGKAMASSGILSVVSFSFAGCLAGSLLFGGRKKVTNSSAWRQKKKQARKS